MFLPPSHSPHLQDQHTISKGEDIDGTFERKQEHSYNISGKPKEVDAVVNLGDVKNGDFDKITEEIASLKKAVGKHILKIIIETCYLEDEEKIALCHAVTDGGADYIKTSTGFGSAGATHSDVVLMRRNVGPDVKVKAAGGIRTISDMKQYLEEGCDRLGCSAAVRLLKDKTDEEI